jgi:hypothetical protein
VGRQEFTDQQKRDLMLVSDEIKLLNTRDLGIFKQELDKQMLREDMADYFKHIDDCILRKLQKS